ncbi:MAG: hypothetical protein HRU22_06775 [Gammaproteobacteria bacterium]|nr:hypothetical protein [Gammaproteobacteria bacterium]
MPCSTRRYSAISSLPLLQQPAKRGLMSFITLQREAEPVKINQEKHLPWNYLERTNVKQ